eukprot:3526789-Pleurochrysis_carterae.AAC.1
MPFELGTVKKPLAATLCKVHFKIQSKYSNHPNPEISTILNSQSGLRHINAPTRVAATDREPECEESYLNLANILLLPVRMHVLSQGATVSKRFAASFERAKMQLRFSVSTFHTE